MITRAKHTSFSFSAVVLVGAAAALAACSGTKAAMKDPSAPAAAGTTTADKGKAASGTSATQPIGASGAGSALVLAKTGGRRVAFIADEDAKAIITIDADTRQQIAETKVGGTPGQVFVTRDGRVLATVRDANKLIAFRVDKADAPLTTIREVTTPAEPIAIAATPDESMIVISAGWGQKLAAFDASTLSAKFEAKLPREPRGVVVSDDGKIAYVSHAVGSVMSAVDLTGPKHGSWVVPMRAKDLTAVRQTNSARRAKKSNVASNFGANFGTLDKHGLDGRQSCQGFVLAKSTSTPNRIFAPQVMVDAGDPEKKPSGYGDASSIPEIPAVAVIDEAAGEPLAASMTVGGNPFNSFALMGNLQTNDPRTMPSECLLPRAAAIDPTTKTLLVTCFGIDSVVAYDAMSGTPSQAVRKFWNVGAGPTGIAVDPDKHQALVFSQFDRTVSTLSLEMSDDLVDDKSAVPSVEKTALSPIKDGVSTQFMVGRMLFHASGDIRISSDGRACASCHPDGRDDAITWATPDGPRRSIMLAGRVASGSPYSWNGNAATIEAHLGSTFKRLKGHGLRSFELEALVSYVSALPAPPARTIDPQDKAKVERGHQIFASTEAGCSSCHTGANFTDGVNHDVQSKTTADGVGAFNTPSLHLVGGTGPYFHDGRYTSLPELLRKSDGKMGHTKQLTNADLDALATYVETL